MLWQRRGTARSRSALQVDRNLADRAAKSGRHSIRIVLEDGRASILAAIARSSTKYMNAISGAVGSVA